MGCSSQKGKMPRTFPNKIKDFIVGLSATIVGAFAIKGLQLAISSLEARGNSQVSTGKKVVEGLSDRKSTIFGHFLLIHSILNAKHFFSFLGKFSC